MLSKLHYCWVQYLHRRRWNLLIKEKRQRHYVVNFKGLFWLNIRQNNRNDFFFFPPYCAVSKCNKKDNTFVVHKAGLQLLVGLTFSLHISGEPNNIFDVISWHMSMTITGKRCKGVCLWVFLNYSTSNKKRDNPKCLKKLLNFWCNENVNVALARATKVSCGFFYAHLAKANAPAIPTLMKFAVRCGHLGGCS